MSASAIDVSVVVCTYNRAGPLREALASLAALETGGQVTYDVVVVDNASTDETAAVIEEVARNYPVPLCAVHEPRPGVACARNRGIRQARGQWIAFFDDDQVADRHWLHELLALAREKEARCVGGANRLLVEGGGECGLHRVCRSLLGETGVSTTPHLYSRKAAPGAGNLLLHRGVFDAVGTFDESLREAGEDADLYRRVTAAGIEGWHAPRAVSYHVIPRYRLRPDYLRWKALRNGSHVARRNWSDWSRGMFVAVLAARIGQAVFVHLPRVLVARFGREGGAVLGTRCLLWRSEGYVRFALRSLAPRLFAQRAFFDRLEFRAERELFAQE